MWQRSEAFDDMGVLGGRHLRVMPDWYEVWLPHLALRPQTLKVTQRGLHRRERGSRYGSTWRPDVSNA